MAADFLRNYLPEPVRQLLDLETLELAKDSFVTVFPEEAAILMATAAEQWMERGKQEGLALGKQEGERTGFLAAIELGLALKFGAAGLTLLPAMHQVIDLDILRALYNGVKVAKSLPELRELYEALTAEA